MPTARVAVCGGHAGIGITGEGFYPSGGGCAQVRRSSGLAFQGRNRSSAGITSHDFRRLTFTPHWPVLVVVAKQAGKLEDAVKRFPRLLEEASRAMGWMRRELENHPSRLWQFGVEDYYVEQARLAQQEADRSPDPTGRPTPDRPDGKVIPGELQLLNWRCPGG